MKLVTRYFDHDNLIESNLSKSMVSSEIIIKLVN